MYLCGNNLRVDEKEKKTKNINTKPFNKCSEARFRYIYILLNFENDVCLHLQREFSQRKRVKEIFFFFFYKSLYYDHSHGIKCFQDHKNNQIENEKYKNKNSVRKILNLFLFSIMQ